MRRGTVIAGIVTEREIIFGADTQTTGENYRRYRCQKIAKIGTNMLIACAGDGRAGQLLEKHINPGPVPQENITAWAVETLAAQARDILTEGGAITVKDGLSTAEIQVMFGVGGHILDMDGTFNITVIDEPFGTIGSGGEIALGALAAFYSLKKVLKREHLETALNIACRYDAFCSMPLTFVSLPKGSV